MNFKFHDNQYIEHIESGEVGKVLPRSDATRELTKNNFPDEDDSDFYVVEFFYSMNSAFGGDMPTIRRKEWLEKNFKPYKRLQNEN